MEKSRNVLFCFAGFVCLFVWFLPYTFILGLGRDSLDHRVCIYRKYNEKTELSLRSFLFLSRLLRASLYSALSSYCKRDTMQLIPWLSHLNDLIWDWNEFYIWDEFAGPLGVSFKADILITSPADVAWDSWQCKLCKSDKLSEDEDLIYTSYIA